MSKHHQNYILATTNKRRFWDAKSKILPGSPDYAISMISILLVSLKFKMQISKIKSAIAPNQNLRIAVISKEKGNVVQITKCAYKTLLTAMRVSGINA